MPLTGVTDSQQLRILRSVLDDYCDQHGFSTSSAERAEASRRVFMLFENGWRTPAELSNALASMVRQAPRKLV